MTTVELKWYKRFQFIWIALGIIIAFFVYFNRSKFFSQFILISCFIYGLMLSIYGVFGLIRYYYIKMNDLIDDTDMKEK